MRTQVTAGSLTRIVESVFITMMDIEVSPSEMLWLAAPDRLASFVLLSGDWNGAVMLECSKMQACQFAGRILCMDPPNAVDDDVRDVLGELANMIGGNMKSGLPMGVLLSMPTVMDGSDFGLRMCGSHISERLGFDCPHGHFWVTVLTTERE